MEFAVSRAVLLAELAVAKKITETRSTIPILGNVALDASDGRVKLTATDLELGLQSSFPAEVVSPGAITVPARRLLDYVRLLPEGEWPVRIKRQENEWINVSCGKSRARIVGMSRSAFPEIPLPPAPITELPLALLVAAINKTLYSVSKEESRFTLKGGLTTMGPEGLTMVGANTHRLAVTTEPVEGGLKPGEFLLPVRAMSELHSWPAPADAIVRIAEDQNNLFFSFGQWTLLARKLAGKFPAWQRIIPPDLKQVASVSRQELKSALERVTQFTDAITRCVQITAEPEQLKIFAAAMDAGEIEEIVPSSCSSTGNISTGFSATYLLEFLRSSGAERVALFMKDANTAAELRFVGEDLYRYVVMPMHI